MKFIFIISIFCILSIHLYSFSVYSFEICSQEYDPVCGVDKITYFNECIMRNAGAVLDYRGVCEHDIGVLNEPPISISDYQDELEEIGRMQARNNFDNNDSDSICTNLDKHACRSSKQCQVNTRKILFFFNRFDSCSIKRTIDSNIFLDSSINCSNIINFVCAEDLRTYPNACFARSQGLEILFRKRCEDIACDSFDENTCLNYNSICRARYSRSFIFFGEKTFEECTFR